MSISMEMPVVRARRFCCLRYELFTEARTCNPRAYGLRVSTHRDVGRVSSDRIHPLSSLTTPVWLYYYISTIREYANTNLNGNSESCELCKNTHDTHTKALRKLNVVKTEQETRDEAEEEEKTKTQTTTS